MTRIRRCVHCAQPFIGRRDAKTCSTRCRKGLQRRRQVLAGVDSQIGDRMSMAQPANRSAGQAGAAA